MCFTALFTAEFALRLYACESVAEWGAWKLDDGGFARRNKRSQDFLNRPPLNQRTPRWMDLPAFAFFQWHFLRFIIHVHEFSLTLLMTGYTVYIYIIHRYYNICCTHFVCIPLHALYMRHMVYFLHIQLTYTKLIEKQTCILILLCKTCHFRWTWYIQEDWNYDFQQSQSVPIPSDSCPSPKSCI